MEKSWENESKYKGGCQVQVPPKRKKRITKTGGLWITLKKPSPKMVMFIQPNPPKKGHHDVTFLRLDRKFPGMVDDLPMTWVYFSHPYNA